jgi:tetratricopeptide (TPR) repeat protein
MPEVSVSSLDSRLQRLVENARVALTRGDFDYVDDVCGQVLREAPGCLPVRRMQRDAQLHRRRSRGFRWFGALGSVTGAGFLLNGVKEPEAQLAVAERILSVDPTSITGLTALAEAATELELPETAVFAWEALRDVQGDDPETLLGLGRAYLAAGRPCEALAAGEAVLRTEPQRPEAVELVRASAVAHAVRHGHWSEAGGFHNKVRGEAEPVLLAQTTVSRRSPPQAAAGRRIGLANGS